VEVAEGRIMFRALLQRWRISPRPSALPEFSVTLQKKLIFETIITYNSKIISVFFSFK
jgi:hypothetical protein